MKKVLGGGLVSLQSEHDQNLSDLWYFLRIHLGQEDVYILIKKV